MSIEIRVATTIRRPRLDIASVMFNPKFAPAWMSGVREVEIEEGVELPELDASFTLITRSWFRRRAEEFDMVEYEPGTVLEFESDRIAYRYEILSSPEGAIVRVWAWLELTPLRVILYPLTSTQLRRQMISDLRRLKQYMESDGYLRWGQEADPSV